MGTAGTAAAASTVFSLSLRTTPVSSGGACTAGAQEEVVLPLQQCACCLELAEKHKKEMHDLASVARQAQGSMCIAREELQQIVKLQQQLVEAHILAVQGQQSTHSEVSMGFQQLLFDSQQEDLWPHLHNIEQAAQQQDAVAKKDRAHAVEVAALTRKLAEVETALEWSAAAFHKLSGKLGE